ncbi:MAG: hypothetical protein RIE73_15755 [Coleofasciculus sp. C1-SOL-03]
MREEWLDVRHAIRVAESTWQILYHQTMGINDPYPANAARFNPMFQRL